MKFQNPPKFNLDAKSGEGVKQLVWESITLCGGVFLKIFEVGFSDR